jgi:hypothetical protein
VLGDFIDANADVGARAPRPAEMILTAGDHHDLRAIYDELNARYFDNTINAAITWGARNGAAAAARTASRWAATRSRSG